MRIVQPGVAARPSLFLLASANAHGRPEIEVSGHETYCLLDRSLDVLKGASTKLTRNLEIWKQQGICYGN